MKYHVYSDNQSWVLIQSTREEPQPFSVSTISKDGIDKFSLKKGIRCALVRKVVHLPNRSIETATRLVLDIPGGQSTYYVGDFVVDNSDERLAKRLFDVFSKVHTWKNRHIIVWKVVDEISNYISVRKLKPQA